MDYLSKYGFQLSEKEMAEHLERLASNMDAMATVDTYKTLFSLMDLTTLKSSDTPASVAKLVSKVNSLAREYPSYPLPASVCVYPNFASVVVKERSTPELHATVVASCFPSTQSFPEVKELECRMAVRSGADEVDIVLPLAEFLSGDYESAETQLRRMIEALRSEAASLSRSVIVKVILETGLLQTPENIATASFMAMEAGADFIKTSTGKVDVNATPGSAYIMCSCIRSFYEKTGRRVGFKAAGGISTSKDALCYWAIVSAVLGKEWLCRELFRLGVSRLGNSLMSSIEGNAVVFF